MNNSIKIQSLTKFSNHMRSAERLKAFSLVEMLMALLVASLLMAALAPVITRKMNENMTISVEGTIPGKKVKTDTISYDECIKRGGAPKEEKDANGNILSEYCEGEFNVPIGFNGTMTVTVIGAGGGGGAAATAGYTEYTTAGSTNTFTVPLMVNKIEATLISGGAGGGAGGQVKKTQTFVTSGNGGITNKTDNDTITEKTDGTGTWNIPEAVRGRNVIASACGGGGGGSASTADDAISVHTVNADGFGGGSGGYVLNKILNFGTASSFTYYIGGGGGGGGTVNGGTLASYTGTSGLPYGGGNGSLANNAAPTGGGAGGSYSSCTAAPANGGPSTSLNAGKGGAGSLNGLLLKDTLTVAATSTCTCAPYTVYTTGGNGGSIGGGGGATMHWCNCLLAGGGGGGAASQILIGTGTYLNAPGGGGAGGHQTTAPYNSAWCAVGTGGGGGGGGGTGGGAGGGINSNNGKAGTNGVDGTGTSGGVIANSIFGSNYCSGGNGGKHNNNQTIEAGYRGKSGAIRLTYLDYNKGGGGGGAGTTIVLAHQNVTAGEVLSVKIGRGGKGGIAGKIDGDGTIIANTAGEDSTYNTTEAGNNLTKILKSNNTMLFATCSTDNHNCGPISGSPDGNVYYAAPYYGKGGDFQAGPIAIAHESYNVAINGFSGTWGNAAGNIFPNRTGTTTGIGTTGGDGGTLTTPWFSCTPGKGGTKSNPKGGDATGYGCGGGGGYGLADGGNGSGGYARISWNKYWNTENNDYDFNNVGAGGGGASGNIVKHTISVKSGERIKYRVGKGGSGAYIVTTSSASVVEATNGGDTIFAYDTSKVLKAGGGNRGGSPSVVNNSNGDASLINGTNGSTSSVCNYNTTKEGCTSGSPGKNPVETTGGEGGSLVDYGKGGLSKAAGRGNTDGGNGTGYGAGGGGASLRDLDLVNPSESATNPTRGGNGADGVIIIRWEE